MKLVPSIVVAVALLARPVLAANEEAQRKAAESFRQAQTAFARRDYSAAAAAFEQAATFAPHPSPLLDASEAWVLAGEPVRAAEDCDRVLAMEGAEAKFRDAATKCIQQLEPKIATVAATGPRTAAIRLDGGSDTTLPSLRRLSPGHHALVVVDLASGASRSFDLDLAPGERRDIDVGKPPWSGAAKHDEAPPATPPPPPPPRHERSSAVPLGTWIAFGTAVVAAGVGGVFGATTLSAQSKFDDQPTRANADVFHRDKAITNVSFAVAGAAAVVGAAIWIAAPSADGASVGVVSRPGGATLAFAASFR